MHGLVAIAPLPPVPRHDLLTSRVPEPLRDRVRPGVRVRVPLGRQTRTGVVAAFADALPPGELRSIVDVLDADPFLPADLLELCRWTARYYLASLAEVIATIVPASLPRPSEERALRLARRLSTEEETALAAGREVVLLVPEIALTHQLVERVRGRFGSEVAVLHSGLGPRERWSEWRRILSGQARVVVGARSAVFAPARRLGLVVVDEEHDAAYKQEEGLRYNARDLAVVRARLAGAVVVLASATPSAESYRAALDGRHRLLGLRERPRGVRGGGGADRGRAARLLPAGGRRPARPRRRAAPRRAAPHPARLARGDHRHPGRHADGEQGARRARRDPGRRAARRPVAQRARLPRRRADLPAPRAGGGPRRPRRHPGARGGAALPPRAPERGRRRTPRLRGLHGARARPPPHARLPALRAPRQPAARRPGRRRGRARRARAGRAHAPACARAQPRRGERGRPRAPAARARTRTLALADPLAQRRRARTPHPRGRRPERAARRAPRAGAPRNCCGSIQ